jgi:hypothetical protein
MLIDPWTLPLLAEVLAAARRDSVFQRGSPAVKIIIFIISFAFSYLPLINFLITLLLYRHVSLKQASLYVSP